MRSKSVDIDLVQGDTFHQTVNLTSGGAPLDLTGYTFSGFVKVSLDAPTSLTTITITTVGDPTQGQILMTIAKTVTATFPPGYLFYEAKWTAPSGDVFTFQRGLLLVSQ